MHSAHQKLYMSRRAGGARLLAVTGIFIVGYLCSLATPAHNYLSAISWWDRALADRGGGVVRLQPVLPDPPSVTRVGCSRSSIVPGLSDMPTFGGRRLMSSDNGSASYPKDAFTLEQRRNGAVVLHIIGMIYMFIALAIVCDEFFVPALGVITEKIGVSEDVSGATFMAAGGSAPELFTSLIGVFIAKNDVGIGTIVGSAVFNILFVIGMCALFSKEVLALTWWPLFRDVSFYSVSLVFLIVFFSDDIIEWWEALILFICYIAYVAFMKINVAVELKVKSFLRRCRRLGNKINNSDQLINDQVGRLERSASLPFIHSGSGRYRHGMVQLMIHTIDPITEAKVHDKAIQLQATLQVIVNPEAAGGGSNNNSTARTNQPSDKHIKVISNGQVKNGKDNPNQSTSTPRSKVDDAKAEALSNRVENEHQVETGSKVTSHDVDMTIHNSPPTTTEEVGPEKREEPLDISWPTTTRKRVTYLLLAPIVFPLYFTLPDVRRPERRKWFPWTFSGSILWIAAFSYCMVWWANQSGETIGIPDEVLGLTVLAAGTSIPDLITSVIVAKKGFGDMAVSSSVGSNLFDITVGLPIPWLLYSAVTLGDAYVVSSTGLLCSIFLLFLMLIAVIICIAASSWKMSKALGVSMLVLYLVFMTLAVLLEYAIIVCPAT